MHSPTSQADSSDTSVARVATHCVFRHGQLWLALPALAIREVLPRPEMVAVPGTPVSFVGLSHVRSEFIPVLNLGAILSARSHSEGQILMVLEDKDSVWAVLVDEVANLQPLETSDAPESDGSHYSGIVAGWATWGDTVVQVLDQARIRQLAQEELAQLWRCDNPLSPGAALHGKPALNAAV